MKVKNINGTSQLKCNCGSWLQHWKNYSGLTATLCKASGCLRTDIVGAHVNKSLSSDNNSYIVPFCNEHNKASDSVELMAGTTLVSANKSKTCG